jgi:hypothetical protein
MSSFNISLTPAQFEFTAQPGATITQAYEITNNSDNTIFLSSSIESWLPSGIEGNVTYSNVVSDPKVIFSLNNADLSLGQGFNLQPQEKRQLVLKIKVDPQSELKDYYYTFFINQTSVGTLEGQQNSTQASGKIGSHVLLSVSNSEQQPAKAEIKNFKVFPKIKDVFLTPINFQAEISNNTDYFFKTDGQITINKNDLKINEIKLMPSNVLSHHSRSITCTDNTVCTLNPPLWPGSYTATLSLDPSISSKSVTISFFVFPFSLIGLLGIIFILFWVFKTHPSVRAIHESPLQ